MNELIELNTRSLTVPEINSVDFGETFVITNSVYAMIETKIGASVFDQSNIERIVTHFFYIRYDANVTAETWINFRSDLYDIVDVEDLDARQEFMLLRCVLRGLDTIETNFA